MKNERNILTAFEINDDIFKNKETRGFYRKQYGFWCMHILVAEEVNIQQTLLSVNCMSHSVKNEICRKHRALQKLHIWRYKYDNIRRLLKKNTSQSWNDLILSGKTEETWRNIFESKMTGTNFWKITSITPCLYKLLLFFNKGLF